MAEFSIIQDYFNFQQPKSKAVIKGIGDDCAILEIPKKQQLVTSTDTLVAGVHFFEDLAPEDLAYKALSVNVSDLLAMGAKPVAFTLAISLPEADHAWLKRFSKALQQACEQYQIQLIGGDTTQGPLSLSLSVFGQVKKGKAVLRSGAQLDDDIWLTGTLGAARAGLKLHQKPNLSNDEQQLWQSLNRPQLAFDFSQKLAKFAHSAIDVSDGLLADLGHIIVQSKLGARLSVEALPILEALIAVEGLDRARQYALNGGDDYQLCFTAHKKQRKKILKQAEQTQTQVTRIGAMCEQGLNVLLNGEPYPITENSWQHFSAE